jgi:putative inorganic carbon (HCO3(-)) transporter
MLSTRLRFPGSGRQAFAFGGLILFTILLYLRPNEWLPIGTFPIVRIVALVTLAAFFVDQIIARRPLSVLPRELKLLLGLAGLMILSIPIGLEPMASLDAFIDEFLKVLLIFILTINVVTSFKRLRRLLEVTTLCGTVIALGTLVEFARGTNLSAGFRAQGIVGGIFGNPNDLALALNLLLPIAIGLGLTRRSLATKALYWTCTGVLGLAVLATYSRAGFLTIAVIGAFLAFRLRRRYPALLALSVAAALVVVIIAPPSFWGRVFTVFDTSDDPQAAASSEIRWALLQRSIEVAGFNPQRWLLGIGMKNFHIVSVHEYAQHNAYLQMFNEVGLPALALYLLFLFGLIRAMGRIVKAYEGARSHRHIWVTAVTLQISLIAYSVGSFFAPVAYLWYLYYVAGFAVCLKQLVLASAANRRPTSPASQEAPSRVWYLRRAQQ